MRIIAGYGFPDGLWYHRAEHLWLSPGAGDVGGRPIVTVGLDALGVHALGELVYVQLVEPGLDVSPGRALGSLEAEKMVRPVLTPLSGTVVEVNQELQAVPRLLNTDPYGRGWLVRIAAGAWARESSGLIRADPDVRAWVEEAVRDYEART